MNAKAAYEAGQTARQAELAVLEARSAGIARVRVVLVLGALGLLGGMVWGRLPPGTWAAIALCVAAFVALVVRHAQVESERAVAQAAVAFFSRGLRRIAGTWREENASPFEVGEGLATPNHPYAGDLDLFGKGSLFHRLSVAKTPFGAATLAAWLKGPAPIAEARSRQEATREIASRTAFRERLSALGAQLGEERPDPAPMLDWAEGKTAMPAGLLWRALAFVLPAVTLTSVAMAASLPRYAWAAALVAQLALTAPLRGAVAKIVAVVTAKEQGLARYGDMFRLVASEPFEAKALHERCARLKGEAGDAPAAMRRLARIVSFAEARNNEVFRLFIAPFFLWDLHAAFALDAWRREHGARVRGWLDVLGEIEAISSLATLAFEDEGAIFPELVDEPTLACVGLAHPLLSSDKRVGNDVTFAGPGHALIVTGSNMSGKSTLLRAVGASVVLALAGGPVVARSMRVGALRVLTSMRIADSLERGVSHFFAELQRLKLAVDMAGGAANGAGSAKEGRAPVLFLLDEILHGTNARERLVGARAVIRSLLEAGALGAVSTHDLAIGDLEGELPGRVTNGHFEEQVEGGVMTFDYRLKSGIVQSSNALRLMRSVGLDVPEA